MSSYESAAVAEDDPTPSLAARSADAGRSTIGRVRHAARPERGARGRRRPRVLTTLAFLAVACFAVIGIGSPLAGTTVFAATAELGLTSPYYDFGLAGTVVRNTYLDDTYTVGQPSTLLFAQELRNGRIASWNPYQVGGAPLAAATNGALLSPLTLPFYLLPGWLAPAYTQLLVVLVAAGSMFLYLRRLQLGRPAALVGGLVFASSAFMVVWASFPQIRVAACIPAVFWAIERLVQERRIRDVAMLAVPVAVMVLGGFPAVLAFTLLTAGAYTLARVLAQYSGAWRRVTGVLVGAAGGVIGGVALSAVQLVPFLSFYTTWLIEGRAQTPDRHLALASLVTSIAPWAVGSVDPTRPPFWWLRENLVESMAYVGAAAVVLLLVAVARARAGRALLPRGAWAALVIALGAWAYLIFLGGPLLDALQQGPVFSNNFIGRARSVLGFLAAALAAVGFELVTSRQALRSRHRLGLLWGASVWAGAAVVGGYAWWRAHDLAISANRANGGAVDRVAHLNRALAEGLAYAAAAVGLVLLVTWLAKRPGRPAGRVRTAAACGLVALLAVQALQFAVPYYPRADRRTYYPVTDVHRYLAANLGGQRFAGTYGAMVFGADLHHKLRALTGHDFMNEEFVRLVRGIPGDPVPYPTYLNFRANPAQATNPILDRLGVRYFVTSPRDPVFGARRVRPGDGSAAVLAPGVPATGSVRVVRPLRAVAVIPAAPLPPASPATVVEVSLRNGTGAEVARARRLGTGMQAGRPFWVPVAAEKVPAGTPLTVRVTVRAPGPLGVAARSGVPVISTVEDAGDGLDLSYAGSSVVYERTRALPRIRWAPRAVVEPDRDARVRRLASGEIGPDAVILDVRGPAASGLPADVRVVEDGTDRIEATVDARGSGYLVVADALQAGWGVTVDGEPARLLHADQGVVAVAVPAGRHAVRLHYQTPRGGTGTAVSAAAAGVLLLLVGADWWVRRRQGGRPG